jgi:predicted membrane protein
MHSKIFLLFLNTLTFIILTVWLCFVYVIMTYYCVCDGKESENEEPAKLNRDVALRALCPNSLFSKVVFS